MAGHLEKKWKRYTIQTETQMTNHPPMFFLICKNFASAFFRTVEGHEERETFEKAAPDLPRGQEDKTGQTRAKERLEHFDRWHRL